MAQFVNIPFLNPFKFVPDTNPMGVHLDEAWASVQIRRYETRVHYRQKWVKSDTTKLQLESTIAPEPLKVIGVDGLVKKSITWTAVYTGVQYSIYELTFDISDLPEAVYFITQRVTLAAIDWRWISEPIDSRTAWPGTQLYRYKNSYNTEGVAFSTGVEFTFRCESAIPPNEMTPKRERATAVSQSRNVRTLSGTPYRTYQLHVGQAPESGHFLGVAPWVLDLLNRIFILDYITIDGKRFESNTDSEWEKVFHKQYPLVAGSIEIVEAFNNAGISAATTDGTTLIPGLVVAYDIEDSAFGGSNTISVTDIETQD
jgi:hypothetical protein